MRLLNRSGMRFSLALLANVIAGAAFAAAPIAWHDTWNDALFAQAASEHRFVLLDLHAVWCHWCHVMDETTYSDAQVGKLIGAHYIAVSIDADSDPDLTSRYGNWGWPATIVLAPDGTEIVKRRGYLPPEQMASLLQAIVDDPSPGPSVQSAAPLKASTVGKLSGALKSALLKSYDDYYDARHGGWGSEHKLIDADSLELAYIQSDSNRASLKAAAARRARTTLDKNLLLIDPVWGGVYQYSDSRDWRSPHFEKLMSYQADDLRLYSEAYARWQDPRYLDAANALFTYIDKFLRAPKGGFYVSQDADLSQEIPGRIFYAYDDAARRKAGMPRVDTHCYARESGWAIRALAKLYDVTGNTQALQSAKNGARWVLANRALSVGGFRHDAKDRGGPFLDDNLAMTQAFLALYRSTGEREWLTRAIDTLNFVDLQLRHPSAGYIAAPAASRRGVLSEPVRLADQNAALARAANMAHRYTGDARYREMALHSMKYMAAFAAANPEQLLPQILLADRELANAPIHIAIVGARNDPGAQALHSAALRYPADYLQIDWLDRSEGDLPNKEIQYPDLERAAAFACADGACSSPVYAADEVALAVRKALDPT
ncbi:MAG: DUF255 domain-containing protein [Steroidobacteraceae bacterium]